MGIKKRWKQWKKRLAVTLIPPLAQGLIHLILWTCRVEIKGMSRFLALAEKRACVLMLWHDSLALLGPACWRHASQLSFAAFVSASRDGELVRRLCQRYPKCRVISVAHNARHHALRELMEQLKTRQEVVLITPDGPRGPRHRMKPGLTLAAQHTQTPIVPFTWVASRFWELRTWDKLRIPKPFSRIVVQFGAPIVLSPGEGEAELEEEMERLATQSSLILNQEMGGDGESQR